MSDYLEKIRHYCAYQERCHSEVRNKLLALSVYGADLEEALSLLIAEGFLNEERFARSYCRGKFQMKQWGKNKIIQSLKFKKVSDYCIGKGLSEIDEEAYLGTFDKLFKKKKTELSGEKNIWVKKKKLKDFLSQRGFEPSLIYEALSKMSSSDQ
jgi:regulatory protein